MGDKIAGALLLTCFAPHLTKDAIIEEITEDLLGDEIQSMVMTNMSLL